MPKRLALVGDHVCDWLDYDERPLAAEQVRVRTEYASGKYGTWAALMDPGTFGGQVLDPRTRTFVPGGGGTSESRTPPYVSRHDENCRG